MKFLKNYIFAVFQADLLPLPFATHKKYERLFWAKLKLKRKYYSFEILPMVPIECVRKL